MLTFFKLLPADLNTYKIWKITEKHTWKPNAVIKLEAVTAVNIQTRICDFIKKWILLWPFSFWD